jgi:hypothetical protein
MGLEHAERHRWIGEIALINNRLNAEAKGQEI